MRQRGSVETGQDVVERQVEELADYYLNQLQAGAAPNRGELVQAHPEIASQLDRRLALVERVFRATQTSRDQPACAPEAGTSPLLVARPAAEVTTPRDDARAQPRSPTPPTLAFDSQLEREAAIHLRCPHCGNHVQLVQADAAEVTCTNCGSTFRVDSLPTTTYPAIDHPRHIGRFHVLELLGRGGFGAVYKARDEELDRAVAIKVPRAGYFGTREEEERFLREARSSARLRHPNIVQVHEVAHDRGMPYIVSDYIEGLTLADLITGRLLGFRETAELVARVADALDYAHREKVIHRDIKPSNILIDRAGRPYITDFGLARRDEGEITVTLDGQILGTPAYMSPEQAAGDHDKVDGRTDVYSLGVVLYRLIAGELPFRGNKRILLHQVLHDEPRLPRSLNDAIPPDLETICIKAMAKEPARRYGSARELADDLRRWLGGEPILARPVSRSERLWRWCRRKPLVAGLAAAIAVLCVGTAIGGMVVAARERGRAQLEQKARLAAEAAEETEKKLRSVAEERLVRLHVANGVHLMDDGDLPASLVWFAEALKLDAADAQRAEVHRIRLASVLRQCPKLVQLWFHEADVHHAEFSRDGKLVVTASADGTARVWEVASGRAVTPPLAHVGPVLHATLSPDARLVATCGRDNTARIWDTATGVQKAQLAHGEKVNHASFSPDGTLVVTASDDDASRVWEAATGRPVTTVEHADHVRLAFFRSDGRAVLTMVGHYVGKQTLAPNEARIWDTETGESLGAIGHNNFVYDAAFSPDGRRVATGDDDGIARVLDVATGRLTELRHFAAVRAVTFSPDGRRVATASQDKTAQVWDAETGRAVTAPLRHAETVVRVAFSADGRRLATAGEDGVARLWDVASGEPVTPWLHHADHVTEVAIAPDGRTVLTGGRDGIVRLWDLAGATRTGPRFEHAHHVGRAAFSPDGRVVATASDDGSARLWDAAAGRQLATTIRHGHSVIDVAFSPDGRRIATASWDRSVHVWDVETGRQLIGPLQHDGGVRKVSFAPDGKLLATASEDSKARVWDSLTGALVAVVEHEAEVLHVAFSPDGRSIATASKGFARIWDARTGAALSERLLHSDLVFGAEFSPDGQRVVTASWDRTAGLWDSATGQFSKLPHGDQVHNACFSPSGDSIATVGLHGRVKLWDAATARPAGPVLRHTGLDVYRASFSSDGRLLATGCGLGRVLPGRRRNGYGYARLWDTRTGEPVTPPLEHWGRVQRASFSPDGRRLLTASYDYTAQIWDIGPDPRPVADLVALAQLLSSHSAGGVSGMVPVDPPALRSAWETLRAGDPKPFACSPEQITAWHDAEADDCEELGLWPQAIAHLDRVIDARPGEWRLYYRRAGTRAELGQWAEAGADLAQAAALAGDESELWLAQALVRLRLGDLDGYRTACGRLVERFAAAALGDAAVRLAQACSLAPDSIADLSRLLPAAEKALTTFPNNPARAAALGSTLYRAGQFDAAMLRLNEATDKSFTRGTPRDWLFLSMTYQRLGKTADAQQWLVKATDWIDRRVAEEAEIAQAGLRPPGDATERLTWQDRAELELLRREAERVVNAKRPEGTSP